MKTLRSLLIPFLLGCSSCPTLSEEMAKNLPHDAAVFRMVAPNVDFVSFSEIGSQRRLSISNGVEVSIIDSHVDKRLQAPLETLVFIHGWGESSGTWRYLVPLLKRSESRRIVLVDLPGFGESGRDLPSQKAGESFLDIQAAMLAEILSSPELNLQHYSIVGHSMGATVSLQSMEHIESLPESLILIAPLDYSLTKPPKTAQLIHHSPLFLARFASTLGLDKKMLLQGLEENVENSNRISHEYFSSLAKSIERKASTSILKRASTTSILKDDKTWLDAKKKFVASVRNSNIDFYIIWGDADKLLPLADDLLIPSLLSVRPKVIEGAGHIIQLDMPLELASEIDLILQK